MGTLTYVQNKGGSLLDLPHPDLAGPLVCCGRGWCSRSSKTLVDRIQMSRGQKLGFNKNRCGSRLLGVMWWGRSCPEEPCGDGSKLWNPNGWFTDWKIMSPKCHGTIPILWQVGPPYTQFRSSTKTLWNVCSTVSRWLGRIESTQRLSQSSVLARNFRIFEIKIPWLKTF